MEGSRGFVRLLRAYGCLGLGGKGSFFCFRIQGFLGQAFEFRFGGLDLVAGLQCLAGRASSF